MTENAQSEVAGGLETTYDSATIEKMLELLPPDMQSAVVDGLGRAAKEQRKARESLEIKTRIAEFAAALHLLLANRDYADYKANIINWDYLAHDTAEAIIKLHKPELEVEVPESVRKAVAYFYADSEFMRDASRDELDEVLEHFGYPTSRILDDIVEASLKKGGKDSPEHVREELEDVFERLDFSQDYVELEKLMRIELLAAGYQLPELDSDRSYGYSDEDGESYPHFTPDMLPA